MEGQVGDNDLEGIIPRIAKDIFNHIHNKDSYINYNIKVDAKKYNLLN